MVKRRWSRRRSVVVAVIIGAACCGIGYGLHVLLTWQLGLYMASSRQWFSWVPTMESPLGIAIPSVLFAVVAYRVVIRPILLPSRETWHCRHCGYALQGLSQSLCPECGETFDPEDPATLATSPSYYRRRWRRRQMVKVLAVAGALVLVAAGYVGWLAWGMYSDGRIVRQMGRSVSVEWRTAGPAWLVKLDWPQLRPLLQRVYAVRVFDGFPNDGLARLAELPYLQELHAPVTDEQLRHARKMHLLRELWLSGPQVTDDGLQHLEGLTNLESLALGGSRITGAGFTHLHNLAANSAAMAPSFGGSTAHSQPQTTRLGPCGPWHPATGRQHAPATAQEHGTQHSASNACSCNSAGAWHPATIRRVRLLRALARPVPGESLDAMVS